MMARRVQGSIRRWTRWTERTVRDERLQQQSRVAIDAFLVLRAPQLAPVTRNDLASLVP